MTAVAQPLMGERMTELMRVQVRDAGSLRSSIEHDADTGLAEAAVRAEPEVGEMVVLVTSASVGIAVECFGRFRSEGDVSAAASLANHRDERIIEVYVVYRQANQFATSD